MTRLKWVAAVLLVFAFCAILVDASTKRRGGLSRGALSVRGAELLLDACEAHRNNSANPNVGKYPATLAELVKPPFGGSSPILSDEDTLIDPWGNPYRYAVLTNAKGEQEVYVWGERAVNGELKLHGAKRATDGTITRFGLEE